MENLSLIKKYQNFVWDQKNSGVINDFFCEEAVIYTATKQTRSISEFKKVIESWFIGFPQLKLYWDDYICDGDKVVVRWHAQGRHDGDFLGFTPTYKNIDYSGVTIYQLAKDKIVQYWAFADMAHIKAQLIK